MANWFSISGIVLCTVAVLLLLLYFTKQGEIKDSQPTQQLQVLQQTQQEIQILQESFKQREKELLIALEQTKNKHQEYPERRLSEDEVKKVLKDFGDEMQLVRDKKKEIPYKYVLIFVSKHLFNSWKSEH